jgi:uncharacterized membrane protein YdjX (TVP38/TMEM64 family)
MRLILAFLAFASIVLLSFAIWGDGLMQIFSPESSVSWLQQYGPWAWIVAMGLLMADLILPLPATIIMSASGYLYGFFYGSLISIIGSFLSGSIAYWLCRSLGEHTTRRILGEKDFERGRRISAGAGAWIVVLSRWLPVLPEVIACMAGLTRMDAVRFHLALFAGTVPLGIIYSYIGYSGLAEPGIAIALSALLPPLIWLFTGLFLKQRAKI